MIVSWHNSQALKDQALATVRAAAARGTLRPGAYIHHSLHCGIRHSEVTDYRETFAIPRDCEASTKHCVVGLLAYLHPPASDTPGIFASVPEFIRPWVKNAWGIPENLLKRIEVLFDSAPDRDRMLAFAVRVLESIPVGAEWGDDVQFPQWMVQFGETATESYDGAVDQLCNFLIQQQPIIVPDYAPEPELIGASA
jgi:hypothetical protein